MHTLPQEVEVWYIIPAIRRDMAKVLISDYNMSYEKTGSILGITKAAVSQYLNNKRAAKIRIHEKALEEIKKSCKKLASGKSDAVKEIEKVLAFIRKKSLHCEKCGKLIDGSLHDCKPIPYKPILVRTE